MMDSLRHKLAEVLIEAAHKGIERMDKNSAMAGELRKIDVGLVLKNDIEIICREVSFVELTRIMAMIIKLRSNEKEKNQVKTELKGTVKQLIDRIEQGPGNLLTPVSCREMLFDL